MAVLERAFADRDAAAGDACAPLRRSAEAAPSRSRPLARALGKAVDGYLAFSSPAPPSPRSSCARSSTEAGGWPGPAESRAMRMRSPPCARSPEARPESVQPATPSSSSSR